jgi:hypothetical protein
MFESIDKDPLFIKRVIKSDYIYIYIVMRKTLFNDEMSVCLYKNESYIF